MQITNTVLLKNKKLRHIIRENPIYKFNISFKHLYVCFFIGFTCVCICNTIFYIHTVEVGHGCETRQLGFDFSPDK